MAFLVAVNSLSLDSHQTYAYPNMDKAASQTCGASVQFVALNILFVNPVFCFSCYTDSLKLLGLH